MEPRSDFFLNARCILHERMYSILYRVLRDYVDICGGLTLKWGRMVKGEFEMFWRDFMVVKYKVLSWRMHGRTEKNHDTILIICSLPGIGNTSQKRYCLIQLPLSFGI